MARRRKAKDDVGSADRQRKARTRTRRERRSQESPERSSPVGDTTWLVRDLTLSRAKAILDRQKQRPFWLSIPFGKGDGNPPVSAYYPCTTFRTGTRTYYGFLFRDHREAFFYALDNARRELTDTVRAIMPQLVG